ncbi:NAD(P)/FAD-dependent oxidoreductase [Candidatus Margulisiibacteriota bacterium]
MKKAYNLIVIGGGPAGMAVAYNAWQNGLKDILILERLPKLGGILNQCIHVGFGLHYFKKELSGTEYAALYKKLLKKTDIHIKTSSCVTKITKNRQITFINNKGEQTISGKNIVLATGCRERTREMLTIPGTRPSGIYTAGLAQEMINRYGIIPGKKVVIIGSGDIGLIMARRLTIEGSKVLAILEIEHKLSGLIRNKVQCLDDFKIPLYLEHELQEVIGKNRVEAIRFRNKKNNKEKTLKCDTLLFSVGLIPEVDLLVDAGLKPGNGIHIIGNADYIHDVVDKATKEAEALGQALASANFPSKLCGKNRII